MFNDKNNTLSVAETEFALAFPYASDDVSQ